ncbi:germin-like protein subfamily 3 member 2 [Cryptomeria japonica]|uniref:germin-like protein subfamily 3 member 2 n=1 Tax=Cryptomeria japonica TaxID=3369 RepID=UPI0025AB6577|nr:germin-like protein subfamily 3 member 2 [Cryptomeria japonica]
MTNIIVGTLFDKRLVEHHLSVMASGQISLRYPFLVILVLVISAAADPDPLQDFCVGILKQSETQDINLNGLPCKDIREVTVDDFVYEGIRTVGNLSATNTGFASTSVSVAQFPGLNTLGMSALRADFEEGAVNVPHLHPRATEMVYVVEGRLYCGFITSENKLYAKVIHKGDVMVFPRGLVHFQMNVGHGPAVLLGSFNSENPGSLKLPFTLFGSGIEDHLLQKAFYLSKKEVKSLKSKFGPKA